jgi:hypothetical protein
MDGCAFMGHLYVRPPELRKINQRNDEWMHRPTAGKVVQGPDDAEFVRHRVV